jgi:hypothetical protein
MKWVGENKLFISRPSSFPRQSPLLLYLYLLIYLFFKSPSNAKTFPVESINTHAANQKSVEIIILQ